MKAMNIKRKGRQGGFTLLEIVGVVGIIGILTVLAIPATRKVEKVVMETGCIKGLHVVQEAMEMYYRETGFYPVHTAEPSRLFFREIDRYLPDTYYIRHAEDQFIRGYRLLAYGIPPEGKGGATSTGGGFGGFGGGGVDRWGSHMYVLMAIPIQNHLGLRTFYLDPGGVVTTDEDRREPY